jgi:nucleoside-diphosphate-sugar epimerase
LEQGHALTLFTRGAPRDANTGTKRWLHWTPGTLREWDSALDGAEGVINLAGEPIAQKKWTYTQRRRIERSRIDATRSLVQACAKAKPRPKFLINASAVGYYGARGDEIITEEAPPGDVFLACFVRIGRKKPKRPRNWACASSVYAPVSCSGAAAAPWQKWPSPSGFSPAARSAPDNNGCRGSSSKISSA